MTWQRGRDRERRRAAPVGDHVHPDAWTEDDHFRYEERVATELHAIRADVKSLARTVTLFLGALGVFTFLVPIVVVIALRVIMPPGG